jgi:signal peptidase II
MAKSFTFPRTPIATTDQVGESMIETKFARVAALVLSILALDIVTKQWALRELAHGFTIFTLDGKLPLTLAFNTGIAFGVPIPTRWLVVAASFVIIGMLWRLLREADERDHWRLGAIGLVLAGAVGNLVDRLRWDQGVVDFIGPINLGFMHWPIFNVADMAITVGAIALGISLLREEPAAEAEKERSAARPLANER